MRPNVFFSKITHFVGGRIEKKTSRNKLNDMFVVIEVFVRDWNIME